MQLDAIIVLGGGTASLDSLRVIAAHVLYQEEVAHNPAVLIVASGGVGAQGTPDAPTLASVIKKELVDLGVPSDAVLTEETSGTTCEQLQECERMARRLGWKKITLISNDYHLPRIQAMIEYLPEFPELNRGLRNGSVLLASAERIAIAHDPAKYTKLIADAYGSAAMKRRQEREAQGVADLRAGRYAFGAAPVTLRKADWDDRHFLFDLRNEPGVRGASFNRRPIALAEHERWFKKRLGERECVFFVAERSGTPIGSIRFDVVSDTDADVNVAVSPSVRGRGYGRFVIRAGTLQFLTERPSIRSVRAYIKPDNRASVRSFTRAGYKNCGVSSVKGHSGIVLIFENPWAR